MGYGDKVKAGDLIGYMGSTGALKDSFIKNSAEQAQKEYHTDSHLFDLVPERFTSLWFAADGAISAEWESTVGGGSESIWQLPSHLHFEYWENEEAGAFRDEPVPKGYEHLPVDYGAWNRRIPVDPRGTFEVAVQSSSTITHDSSLTEPTRQSVKEQIAADKDADPKEIEGILNL